MRGRCPFSLRSDDTFAKHISDAAERTVDHADVTVAAKPKARDDEPWLIATRNKKLRFAFACCSRTWSLSLLSRALMYLFRSANSCEPTAPLPLDGRPRVRASRDHTGTRRAAVVRVFSSARAPKNLFAVYVTLNL